MTEAEEVKASFEKAAAEMQGYKDGFAAGIEAAANVVKAYKQDQPELMQCTGMRWHLEHAIRALKPEGGA